jgi:acetyl-CoA carboxylase / biotin carboxylase 1
LGWALRLVLGLEDLAIPAAAMGEQNGQGASAGVTVPVVNGQATYAQKHSLASHFIGGNKLDNAPPSKVKDFVASHDGHTVITNVSLSQ